MATKVTGEQKFGLLAQLREIGTQVEAPGGYPYNPVALKRHLQAAIEGQMGDPKSARAVYWGNWTPDLTLHRLKDPVGRAVDSMLRSNKDFPNIILWTEYVNTWMKEFPGRLVYITCTPYCFFAPASEGLQQLRLWFGEPKSYGESHVDSRGHHLIAGANLLPKEIDRVVSDLVNGVSQWSSDYEYKRRLNIPGILGAAAGNIKVWELKKRSS